MIRVQRPSKRTDTSPSKNNGGITADIIDALANSFTLGVDAEGRTHHYYRPADTVVVFDGRTLCHREHLDGRTVREWVAFVTQDAGWTRMGPYAELGINHDADRKETL